MADKTRILIVVSNMEYGGAQRQIVELLNNVDRSCYEVHLVSLSDYIPLAAQLQGGQPVHIVRKRARFDLGTVFGLRRLLIEHRIDIIHSYLFDAEIAARLAALLTPFPVRVVGGERNTDYTLKKVQLAAYWCTKRLFDLIIANSASGAAFNQRYLNQPPERYRVVYNGVDTERFRPASRAAARAALGIDSDAHLLGVFASFKAQKNHPFLLDAALKLAADYPRLKLLLVGDQLHAGMHGSDAYHAALLERIEHTELKERCILAGNRDDVETLYPACDFTVLPSLFEGTPNTVLESMACGVPAIATRVSDNDRILTPDSGLIVDVGDHDALTQALRQLLDNPAATDELGRGARNRIVEHFSSAVLARNTQAIWDELVPRQATSA